MEKTIETKLNGKVDVSTAWKTLFPQTESGKKWYYVDSNFSFDRKSIHYTANLAPVITLCGMECEREIERKAFVKVKKQLKEWGHQETPKNILNAAEYLWESKKIRGCEYQDFVNNFYNF